MSTDTWQRAIDADLAVVREAAETNLYGPWLMVQEFLPLLRASTIRGRRVVLSFLYNYVRFLVWLIGVMRRIGGPGVHWINRITPIHRAKRRNTPACPPLT